MKKNLLIALISIVCLILGTSTLIDISKLRKTKTEKQQLDVSKIDLSKIEFNVEGQDLTKPFIDTTGFIRPKEIEIHYVIKGKNHRLNSLGSAFTRIDTLFNEIGAPNRYKSIMQNSTSYVYDDLGFYVKTDEQENITSYSFYFQNGKLDIAPNKIFDGDFRIGDLKISSTTKIKELQDHFSVQAYLRSDSYYFEKEGKRFAFSYDNDKNTLINVLVEKI